MGIIQGNLNQALMGTAFLLGQSGALEPIKQNTKIRELEKYKEQLQQAEFAAYDKMDEQYNKADNYKESGNINKSQEANLKGEIQYGIGERFSQDQDAIKEQIRNIQLQYPSSREEGIQSLTREYYQKEMAESLGKRAAAQTAQYKRLNAFKQAFTNPEYTGDFSEFGGKK